MLVARTIPLPPFDAFRTEMERLMDEALETARPFGVSTGPAPAVFPPINAWQDEKALYVEAELPGFKPDEVEIAFEHETLIIKGKREPLPIPEPAAILRRERWTGEFERTVRFSLPVDPEQVKATLINGILTIMLPKQAAAQPRKIVVKPA
jgi:HSP20 family protein